MASIASFKQAVRKGQPVKKYVNKPPIGDNVPREGRWGYKEIFLPTFRITLCRSNHLPPQYASFIVPLSFNKLDMRDYMYHVYGIKTLSIRSFVEQAPVQRTSPYNFGNPNKTRWFRPNSKKKMTIEMDKPFIWPDPPTNLDAWDKKRFEAVEKAQKEMNNKNTDEETSQYIEELLSRKRGPTVADRAALASQAKRLLSGHDKWKPGESLSGYRGSTQQ